MDTSGVQLCFGLPHSRFQDSVVIGALIQELQEFHQALRVPGKIHREYSGQQSCWDYFTKVIQLLITSFKSNLTTLICK